jgi:hypothetical protein
LLLFSGVIVPLQTQLENRRIQETERLLDDAREALLQYALTFGYFPCPADVMSAGQEPFLGVDHATGACPSYSGFLPASLLDFSSVDEQGYALDAWGSTSANRIRYAVSDQTIGASARAFTRSGGMAAAGMSRLISANGLYICGSGAGVRPGTDCGSAQTLASNAVIVVWSVGPNGTIGGRTVDEAENPNPNGGSVDRIFVSKARSDVAASEFDDMLTWTSSATIVSRLLAAGQLP